MMDSPHSSTPLLRPQPQRPASSRRMFHLTPMPSHDAASGDDISPASEGPSSPTFGSASLDRRPSIDAQSAFPPQKSRSILNLTTSTLFGIYSGDPSESGLFTPFGTGAQTPTARNVGNDVVRRLEITTEDVQRKTAQAKTRPRAGSRSAGNLRHTRPPTNAQLALSTLLRTLALFVAGVAYGLVVTRLHESRSIAPVEVQLGIVVDRSSWVYLGFWGIAGVVLGTLLPRIERALATNEDEADEQEDEEATSEKYPKPKAVTKKEARATYLGAEWHPLVRSVGAFVGIAFAIRRLPWQSTLQVSLTLALVNPCLWYLIDRSRAGFLLSSFVGLVGAAVLLGTNPGIVPAPASAYSRSNSTMTSVQDGGLVGGVFSYEGVGVATWIASVLFCSSVCFKALAQLLSRRLA